MAAMSERTSYAPGTPCWVDLGSPDLDAAVEFYSGLFGWEVPELPNSAADRRLPPGEKGRQADVAGMMPLMQEGQPPAWSSYVSVADADATAAAVQEAGGSVIAEPMDVMDLGRMAVFADPTGAVFGIWQPGTFPGAELRQRARRALLERARHPRPRRRQGLLRRRLRLGLRRERHGRDGHLHRVAESARARSAACSTSAAAASRRGPGPLARLLRGRGHRRGGGDGQARRRRRLASARSTSRSAASPILTDPHGAAFAVIAAQPKNARPQAPRR